MRFMLKDLASPQRGVGMRETTPLLPQLPLVFYDFSRLVVVKLAQGLRRMRLARHHLFTGRLANEYAAKQVDIFNGCALVQAVISPIFCAPLPGNQVGAGETGKAAAKKR